MADENGFGEYEFICPYCEDYFQDPILTLCRHRFCYNCFVHFVRQIKECPICFKSTPTKRAFRFDFHFKPRYVKFMKSLEAKRIAEKEQATKKIEVNNDDDINVKVKAEPELTKRKAENENHDEQISNGEVGSENTAYELFEFKYPGLGGIFQRNIENVEFERHGIKKEHEEEKNKDDEEEIIEILKNAEKPMGLKRKRAENSPVKSSNNKMSNIFKIDFNSDGILEIVSLEQTVNNGENEEYCEEYVDDDLSAKGGLYYDGFDENITDYYYYEENAEEHSVREETDKENGDDSEPQ